MKCQVEVSEMLQRIVYVEAESHEEAIDKVRQLYRGGQIVLSSNGFVGVEFNHYSD